LSLTFDGLDMRIQTQITQGVAPMVEIAAREAASASNVTQEPSWQSRYRLDSQGTRETAGYLFVGHGDGMHMLLDGASLCGARKGRRADGCVHGVTCRKQRVVTAVHYAADARGDVAFLLSCNSANLAGQYGSPNVSLARALIEAGFSAVVASTRQVRVSTAHEAIVREGWRKGLAVTEIVNTLNAREDLDRAYIVVTPEGSSLIGSRAVPPISNLGSQVIAVTPLRSVRAMSEMVLACQSRSVGRPGLLAALREQYKLLSVLAELLTREELSTGSVPRTTRQRIETAVLSGWRRCADQELLGGKGSFGDLLQQAVLGDRVLSRSTSIATRKQCRMCGGEVRKTIGGVSEPWEVLWCNGCGISRITHEPERGVLAMDLGRTLVAKHTHPVRLRSPAGDAGAILFLQARDKSTLEPICDETLVVEGVETVREIRIPDDAGPDLGSCRAVLITPTSLMYTRQVFEIVRERR
jgi:hypothetical protein